MREPPRDPHHAFIHEACVPLDADHGSGTLDRANAILAAHPDVATGSIHAAAILGDADAVGRMLERDPGSASAKGGPRQWDPLTHLCFSRYLRLDRSRSDGFVATARTLLDAGATPNTGWFESSHQPRPVYESAIYGAAGIAKHAPLTRLLLERGADPNDEETPYHAPEGYDNEALRALVESGKLNDDSLATILLRKTDWHDGDAIVWLLDQGVDPNLLTHWGKTALHNAVLSDNALRIIEALLDHGADPTRIADRSDRSSARIAPRSAIAMAARRGRGDVLNAIAARGWPLALDGVDRLIAACAMDDTAAISALIEREPHLARELVAEGGRLLAEFAGNGNTAGVARLMDVGVPVGARYVHGDGYFGIPPGSTGLHVAAWRAHPDTVRLLVARGAAVDEPDANGRTPLALAVRATVDSYWTWRRSPDSVDVLLAAGASPHGVPFPSGYGEVDALLRRHGAGA